MNDGWQLRVYDGGNVYVADLAVRRGYRPPAE